MTFDLDRPWQVAAPVALRPEPFGALAYNFQTRRLSFLKTRKLLEVVRALEEQDSGRDACAAAGVVGSEIGAYQRALEALASSGMIVERHSR